MPKTVKLKMQLDTTIIHTVSQSVNHWQYSILAEIRTLCTNYFNWYRLSAYCTNDW